MDKKKLIKIGLYTLGGVILLGGGIITVNAIKHKSFSAQGKKRGEDRRSEDIIGKTVSVGSEGFVNVRSTPEIPNSITNCAWYDAICWGSKAGNYLTDGTSKNIIKKSTSNPVGNILRIVKGADGWNWYEIEFEGSGLISEDLDLWWSGESTSTKIKGFVREDAVVIN